jgi:hypothetical protein
MVQTAGSVQVILLNHTTPGTLSLATSYNNLGGNANDVAFTSDGNYLAAAHAGTPRLTVLDHTTPGSLSFAASYTLGGTANGVAFNPSNNYLAVAHSIAPRFTLLNHSAGSLSLAATYTLLWH